MSTKYNISIKFGKRVRDFRKYKKLSQQELADLANMHRTYIGMIERAEKNISLYGIKKLADALEMKVSDLIGENL
tara:strand:- start:265 stop:489 length:225 start_codon:yes stop_codon:yes gene_type:complete